MNLIKKLKDSLRFNEVTVGLWGVSLTFRWSPRKLDPPRGGGIPPWVVGAGALLLVAALTSDGKEARHADAW